MHVKVTQVNGYRLFALSGPTGPESELATLLELVEHALATGSKGVAVSLSTDTFLLSRVISTLIQCSGQAQRHGADFAVVAATPRVLQIFRRLRLGQKMRVCSTVAELQHHQAL